MKPKRKVSGNLGRTQYRDGNEIYAGIRARRGPYKRCPYKGKKSIGDQRADMHDVLNPTYPNPDVPIEQFNFCLLTRKGEKYWDLQTYCIICHMDYRGGRSREAHLRWDPLTDDAIRAAYRKEVGATMQCSVCEEEKEPEAFGISRGMEKGLHNECLACVSAKSASIREQIWLSDGDWDSWKTAVAKMRRSKQVACAGWSRAQEAGLCLGSDIGKRMHADHIIPLRAGGIHDARNFQPLCSACNLKKTDLIDPLTTSENIRKLVGKLYQPIVRDTDSALMIERALKGALIQHLQSLLKRGAYRTAIEEKKREVNGQWNVERAYRKGVEWLEHGGGRLAD